jgi:phage tail sheath protein FI
VLTAGSPGEPVTGQAVAMTGGNDGITGAPGELNSAVSGSIIAGNPTGLKIFEDSEQLDINLLSAPGFSDGAIINEVIRICEARHDSLGLVDPPALLTPTEVVDFHNGTGIWTGLHAAFNSSFGALFYDWLKVNDEYNATQLYIPPSGHASACIARTDRETQPWFAPAGMRRGRASTALAVGHSPNQGQRDLMMGGTNRVNPFVNFAREGINLFGQMTLQRFASSLDRINVRRLLNTIEKTVATSSRVFLFEPNDRVTWRQWKGVVDPVLRDIVARRGLIEYALIMDESTTTPLSIDRGEMHGKIYLKPVKAAEKIILDFIVTSQGATFNELVVAA